MDWSLRFVSHHTAGDGCWIWCGAVRKGYGVYNKLGRQYSAHRLSYELHVGPIPAGLEIDHLCRNTICVNPDHLEPVDRAENMRRRVAANTHCKRGHEFTPDNIYVQPSRPNTRSCWACKRAKDKRRYARIREDRAKSEFISPQLLTNLR